VLLILFLVRLALGYQFQSIASISSHLVSELGFSYAEIGTLIGFFLLPGIVIAIPSGVMTRAVLLEQNDEWAVQRARHMTLETIAPIGHDD
jgi:hypothetical protein